MSKDLYSDCKYLTVSILKDCRASEGESEIYWKMTIFMYIEGKYNLLDRDC